MDEIFGKHTVEADLTCIYRKLGLRAASAWHGMAWPRVVGPRREGIPRCPRREWRTDS
jgi:hypothetical protein